MSFRDGPPEFVPLDWTRPIKKYRRRLPHWVQEGATYFITFRLVDSLPAEKLRELEHFRQEWEFAHPPPRTEEDWDPYHREIMQRIDDWLDAGSGECLMRDPQIAGIVST